MAVDLILVAASVAAVVAASFQGETARLLFPAKVARERRRQINENSTNQQTCQVVVAAALTPSLTLACLFVADLLVSNLARVSRASLTLSPSSARVKARENERVKE